MNRLLTILMSIMIMAAGFAAPVLAKDPDSRELAPIIKTKPEQLVFNCNIVERSKEIIAVNASKRTMPLNASSSASWIAVSPSSQPDVRPMGSAVFNVSVDCKQLRGEKIKAGAVTVEGMGFRSRVPVRVRTEPQPERPEK